MDELEPIGDFLVCRNRDGDPISLRRVAEEIVCLGFAPHQNRIVEIHVIADTDHLKGNGKLSFLERGWNAGTLITDGFSEILTTKEDNGLFYYVTDVNDGEFLTDYILRNGPLLPATSLALVSKFVESLIEIEPHYRLLLGLKLERLMIVLKDSSYLTLRAIDLGLARPEPRGINEFEISEMLAEVSRHLFHLLTGRPYADGRMDLIDQISSETPLIGSLLAKTIEPKKSEVSSFEEYSKLLKDCYTDVADGLTLKSAIVAYPKIRPRLTLQREIFEKANFKKRLEDASITIEASDSERFEYPYSSIATKADGRRGRLSWFPSTNVLPMLSIGDESILAPGFGYHFVPSAAGLSLQHFLVQRNHQPDPIDSIRILNTLAQQIDSGDIGEEPFSYHQLWLDFSESNDEINDIAKLEVAKWPEFRFIIFPNPDTNTLLCRPPFESDEASAPNPLLSFIETARRLLSESDESIQKFLDESVRLVRSESAKHQSCASLLVNLADHLEECSNSDH